MNDMLRFRLIDPDAPDGAPAEDWARALGAFQKLAHALARLAAPWLRPNTEFRRRYELRARLSETGDVALAIGPRQLSLDLRLGTTPAELGESLWALLTAVGSLDAAAVAAIAPAPATRRALLREVAKLLPKGPERWAIALAMPDRAPMSLGIAAAKWVETELAASAPGGPLMMTVTGELVGVDFGKGTFAFRYAPTGRVLDGRYAPDEEVALLKSRRKLIHVSGEFQLDAEDHPVRVKRVLKVSLVDLSPVTLETVQAPDGRAFALVPPLHLVPTMDADSQQLYEVQDEALELYVTAPTREQLESDVLAHVAQAAASPGRAWKRRLHPMLTAALE
ncbi:MAG: hypothetical protein ACK46X_09795 [Candidatus Sericytochromatia bacterium]